MGGTHEIQRLEAFSPESGRMGCDLCDGAFNHVCSTDKNAPQND